MRIALYQPDIALNVGAVARTAACLGLCVDIIKPCGFPYSAKALKKSGMDYLDLASLTDHQSWQAFQQEHVGQRRLLFTTKADSCAQDFSFTQHDILLFGRESAGVPLDVHQSVDARLRLPMKPEARSLNLAISVAIAATLAYDRCGLFTALM